MSVFVLVHGSWHDAAAFDDLAERLRQRGYTVFNPALAGHGQDVDRDVSHDDCVRSVIDCFEQNDLTDVILVGHSWGGSVIARTAPNVRDRIHRMVFWAGFVPADGTSVLDNAPAAYQEAFPVWAAQSTDNTVTLPFEVWRDGFIGDADLATAKETYDRLVPEPFAPTTDKLDLSDFYAMTMPFSYLLGDEDVALPPFASDTGYYLMARRLGLFRLVTYRGSHEAFFLDPDHLAEKIELAGRD